MNKIEKRENYSNQTFEEIKHIDENGIETQRSTANENFWL